MRRPLPVIDGPDGAIGVGADPSSERRVARRDLDRRIAISGVALAFSFIIAAAVAIATGRSTWMVLHLVLAGAAGTAIVSVMPFFAAALSMAPPAPPRLRVAAVAFAAIGASSVAVAIPVGLRAVSLLGAGAYLVGIGGLAAGLIHASRRGLGGRHRVIVAAYGVGVAFVLLGVTLVLAYLHSFAPVTSRWSLIKPAHAWLNLVGFVGLTLAATYLHLVPTVLGSRVVLDRRTAVGIGALALGVAGVSLGFLVGSDLVVRLGAVTTLVGAAAVPAMAVRAARQSGRGRWTTERSWHEFTTASLVASTVWVALGVGTAAMSAFVHGASPAAWGLARVGVPLVIGGVLQALIASATHLVPTLQGATPGARSRLGRAGRTRVIAWQLATAAMWAAVAVPLGGVIDILGKAALGLAVAGGVLLVISVLVGGPRSERRLPAA
jgi:nitrite reductase (NO-forming)